MVAVIACFCFEAWANRGCNTEQLLLALAQFERTVSRYILRLSAGLEDDAIGVMMSMLAILGQIVLNHRHCLVHT